MLVLTLASFGAIVAVNFLMAFFATSTFPGLVVDNSYVASQNYNALLAQARAQEEAGWKTVFSASQGLLRLTLADRRGVSQQGLAVGASVGRPTSAREDRQILFTQSGESYLSREALADGVWGIDLEAREGDRLRFRQTRHIVLQAGRVVGDGN